MKKQYPFYLNNRFYNQKKEIVSIQLKAVIWHYILNIGNKSHLYQSKKNNNFIPFSLCFDYMFLMGKSIYYNDIIVIPLGHATVLVIYNNKTILFDPVFQTSSLFLKRYANNINIKDLPPIDIIVYSHNHPDHYNKENLLELLEHYPHVQVFAPLGFEAFFKKENIMLDILKSMTWWEEEVLFFGIIKLTALPAVHWSQSNISNRNETLWASWLLTINDVNIYFAGDTAYSNHFKAIAENFKKIHIACIPIAPYVPQELQIDSHMDIEESFQSFVDLGQPIFIPIHWGVFAYGDEPLKEPIEKIIELFNKNNIIDKLKSTIINLPYIYRKE